ncbi:MAG TPA: RNA pyrophosphohydrolase [Devosia sp.]|nr:RNA pyrophosphohydrolase [Devosia sp.]
MASPSRTHLPYRACAGVALFNRKGKVFVGRRKHMPRLGSDQAWQMPQGGIDPGEDPFEAAVRELYEETNITSVQLLAAAKDWLAYDFPDEVTEQKKRNKFRGQRQMWFAMLFTGDDEEIDIEHPAKGKHRAEFSDWRWKKLHKLPKLIVPFKRDVYRQLADWFADLPDKIRSGEFSRSQPPSDLTQEP